MLLPLGTGPITSGDSALAASAAPVSVDLALLIVVSDAATLITVDLPITISVIDVVRQADLPLRIVVVDERAFEYAGGVVTWAATVAVAGIDFSGRLTGKMSIEGAEDSARVASFALVPRSEAELAALELAAVTIDLTVGSEGHQATYRRFTGSVEQVDFDPVTRVASLSCRDGYQARIKSCSSAAAVEALLGGLSAPCAAALAWSDSAPDPSAYFNGLLATLPGAVAIDGSGSWTVQPWVIGAPLATFAAVDIFDESVSISQPAKRDVPAAVFATATVRYSRLHAVLLPLIWEGLTRYRIGLDGCTWPLKTTVQAALSGLSGWYIKDNAPALTQPPAGTFPLLHDGTSTPFVMSPQTAAVTCVGMTAQMYTRWYQEVDLSYSINIDMGGASDRDESVAVSVSSAWSASDWESAASSETASEIYSANAPVVPGATVTKTGYEALPAPYPPGNGALDYCPDVDIDGLVRHVAARAIRTAAAGLRKRQVKFARPLDPRFEVGAVLAISAHGVTARGQVVDFADAMDHDSGDISTKFTLACPEARSVGSAVGTSYSVAPAAPSNSVAHALAAPTLSNWVGSSTETQVTPAPDEDAVCGWLCNVSNQADMYLASAPVYVEQFRIVMPEIGAAVRDPVAETSVVSCDYSISGGDLTVIFEG